MHNIINNLFLGKNTYIYLLKCQEQAQAVNVFPREQRKSPDSFKK